MKEIKFEHTWGSTFQHTTKNDFYVRLKIGQTSINPNLFYSSAVLAWSKDLAHHIVKEIDIEGYAGNAITSEMLGLCRDMSVGTHHWQGYHWQAYHNMIGGDIEAAELLEATTLFLPVSSLFETLGFKHINREITYTFRICDILDVLTLTAKVNLTEDMLDEIPTLEISIIEDVIIEFPSDT